MKYIFLDIDGVLNGADNAWQFIKNPDLKPDYRFLDSGNWVEIEILNRLKRLVKNNNAVIIGISSWFAWSEDVPDDHFFSKKSVIKGIEDTLQLPVYSVVDYTGGSEWRGSSVLKWLKDNNYSQNKDAFVVLDDGGDRYYNFPTVICNGKTGLTEKNLNEAQIFLDNSLNLAACQEKQINYKYKGD